MNIVFMKYFILMAEMQSIVANYIIYWSEFEILSQYKELCLVEYVCISLTQE